MCEYLCIPVGLFLVGTKVFKLEMQAVCHLMRYWIPGRVVTKSSIGASPGVDIVLSGGRLQFWYLRLMFKGRGWCSQFTMRVFWWNVYYL